MTAIFDICSINEMNAYERIEKELVPVCPACGRSTIELCQLLGHVYPVFIIISEL
jgi:hypothetical protein